MDTLMCRCGGVIPESAIELWFKCNEEGEDFTEIECQCPDCERVFEASTWGDCNIDEARDILQFDIIDD